MLSDVYQVGRTYLIRTVTQFQAGRVKSVDNASGTLTLEDAAWIADTGRFFKAVRDSDELMEVEPVGTMIVHAGAIVDAVPVNYDLPLQVK